MIVSDERGSPYANASPSNFQGFLTAPIVSFLLYLLQAAQEALQQLTTERVEGEPLPEIQVRHDVYPFRGSAFTCGPMQSVALFLPCCDSMKRRRLR